MIIDRCLTLILLLIFGLLTFFLGCLITYDCAFYERECTITVDDKVYETTTYPYISKSDGTVSFKMKSGARVELPYKKVVIEIEQ